MVHSSALQVFRGTFAFFFTCRLGIRAAVGRRHVAFLGHVTCILIGPFSRCLGFGRDTLIVIGLFHPLSVLYQWRCLRLHPRT